MPGLSAPDHEQGQARWHAQRAQQQPHAKHLQDEQQVAAQACRHADFVEPEEPGVHLPGSAAQSSRDCAACCTPVPPAPALCRSSGDEGAPAPQEQRARSRAHQARRGPRYGPLGAQPQHVARRRGEHSPHTQELPEAKVHRYDWRHQPQAKQSDLWQQICQCCPAAHCSDSESSRSTPAHTSVYACASNRTIGSALQRRIAQPHQRQRWAACPFPL